MRSQRIFIAVAGLLFAALFAVHVARIVFEGPTPLHDPFFVGITLIALGVAGWSAFLLVKWQS